jgi:hypothetical protein
MSDARCPMDDRMIQENISAYLAGVVAKIWLDKKPM